MKSEIPLIKNSFRIRITYNIKQYVFYIVGGWECRRVAALLFVTSSVILVCIVVEFAVATFEQTLDTEDAPQIDRIRKMENMILDQTDNLFNEIESLNQTDTQQIDQILP